MTRFKSRFSATCSRSLMTEKRANSVLRSREGLEQKCGHERESCLAGVETLSDFLIGFG